MGFICHALMGIPLLALMGCAPQVLVSDRINDLFGRSTDTLTEPDRVEAFRIRRPEGGGGFTDWPVTAGPVVLDSVTVEQVSVLLLDEKNYWPKELYKSCLLRPGVKLVFAKGRERAAVYLCYECRMLVAEQAVNGSRFAYFEPAVVDFVRLAKRLFPGDLDIQALRDDPAPQ